MNFTNVVNLVWATFLLIYIITMTTFIVRLIVGIRKYSLDKEYRIEPDPCQYKGRIFFCTNGQIHTMDKEPQYGPGKNEFNQVCADTLHERKN